VVMWDFVIGTNASAGLDMITIELSGPEKKNRLSCFQIAPPPRYLEAKFFEER